MKLNIIICFSNLVLGLVKINVDLNQFLSESVRRQYTSDYKLDTYLKIARLYLEDEDPVQAEAYINRASLLQSDSSNEELQIYYKVYNIYHVVYL